MDTSLIIISLGLLIFCSHIFSALFSKIRIPSVLLLMLIGLLMGPLLHVVSPNDWGRIGSIFTTITLIVIMFESGTNLDLQVLKKTIVATSTLTMLNFIISMAIVAVVGRIVLNISWMHSVFLGAALGGTSVTVIVPMLRQLKPSPKTSIILSMESTISTVLCLVVGLAVLEGISTGDVSVGEIFKNAAVSVTFAVLGGVLIGFVWVILLKKYLNGVSNNMFTSFALAFIIYGICDHIGLNGELAVLAFGITLGNIDHSKLMTRIFTSGEDYSLNENEKNFYSEIVFIFQTYFFVYIGLCFQFHSLTHTLVGALLVVLLFAIRPFTSLVIGKKDITDRDRNLINVLAPKGLVAAVLASLPLQAAKEYNHNLSLGLGSSSIAPEQLQYAEDMISTGQVVQNVSYSVVFFSIVLSSLLVFIIEKRMKE